MNRPLITIYDLETQETITRELTDEEYAQALKDKADAEAEQAAKLLKEQEAEAAKAAVEAKLAALGLDLDTVKAIAKLG